jgi:hypothetical protein
MRHALDNALTTQAAGARMRGGRAGWVLTALALAAALLVTGGLAAPAGASALPAGAAGPARLTASPPPDPESLAGTVDAFKAAASSGFTVQEGKLSEFDIAAMYDAGLIPSCWAYNGSTPYLVYKLPDAPGQKAQNNLTDAQLVPEDEGLWADYRLRPDEALVFIGRTPPECTYFSYRGYLAVRYFDELRTKDKRRRVFASLGDTTSSVRIKTTGTPADPVTGKAMQGDPFEKTTVIVTTADKETAARVKAALVQAGYSPRIVNDDIIPRDLVRMGLEARNDTFTFINRVAMIKDPAAESAYFGNPQGTVLRLTPKQETLPRDLVPYPVPALLVRGTGNCNEFTLKPTLEELRSAIVAKFSKYAHKELDSKVWIGEGYDAIQQGIDGLGENRDTIYLRSGNFLLTKDPSDFAIVFGVNHSAFGKVLYSNFGAYSDKILAGIGAVTNDQLGGTADAYLPGNPLAKYFYVWAVARQPVPGLNTLVVQPGKTAETIAYDNRMFMGFRAYVEPSTGVGPYYAEVLYDRVIKFGRKK